MYKYRYGFLVITFLIITAISGCSDDPASADPEDAPEVPESTPAEVDTSFFTENSAPSTSEYSGFNQAAAYAQTANGSLAGSTSLGGFYLAFTEGQQAEFENGEWVWTFSWEEDGESVTIKTTAREVSNGVEWSIFMSGIFEDEVVDEFLFVSGFMSNDGNSGNWKYYFPDESNNSILFLSYEWNVSSDTNVMLKYSIFNEDGSIEAAAEYNQNGAEHFLEFTTAGNQNDVLVYWNTETGLGYYEEGGERTCWDENLQNTVCPG